MEIVLSFVSALIPSVEASAGTACSLIGGNCGATNAASLVLAPLANLLIGIVAGGAVLAVVAGGALMLFSFGDESRYSQGRGAVMFAVLGFVLARLSQAIVLFVGNQYGSLDGSADPIQDFLAISVGSIRTLFNAVFILIIIVAGYRMIIGRGNSDDFTKAKQMLNWGVIGAVIVNLAGSIINATLNVPLV